MAQRWEWMMMDYRTVKWVERWIEDWLETVVLDQRVIQKRVVSQYL